jgi:hypothetical protein
MKDPGIEEVRQARHEISRECGHDLHKVAAYYRDVERELRRSGRFQFEAPPSPGHAVVHESAEGDRKVAT